MRYRRYDRYGTVRIAGRTLICRAPLDISDAILILRHAMGAGELTEMQLVLADIDNSGDVSAVDALTVLRRAMGLNGHLNELNRGMYRPQTKQ